MTKRFVAVLEISENDPYINDLDDLKEEWSEHLYLPGRVVSIKPLPKEHGRLGDLDALEKEMICGIKAGNFEEGYEEYSNINNIDDCVECVRFADTIIEADAGETE